MKWSRVGQSEGEAGREGAYERCDKGQRGAGEGKTAVRGAGVYILVENGYLFPPPSEIYIFSPKKQRDFRATLPTKQRKLQILEKIDIENF